MDGFNSLFSLKKGLILAHHETLYIFMLGKEQLAKRIPRNRFRREDSEALMGFIYYF